MTDRQDGPRTEAGRWREPNTRAGEDFDRAWPGSHIPRLEWRERILAIEAEAAAGPRDSAAVGLAIGAAYLDGLAAAGPRDEGLDVAWREAEAALPEGWHVGEVKNTDYRVSTMGDGERWLVMAWEFGDNPDYRTFESAYGPTPAAALRALAARLRDAASSETAESERD
jgi:hypothetical protein